MTSVLRQLSQIDILRALPPEEILELAPLVTEVKYDKGDVIIREGDEGDALYFLEKGTAEVIRSDSSKKWTVKQGSVIGEMAILRGELRNATVTALADIEAWKIAKADFQRVIQKSPTLKAAIEGIMERRLMGMTSILPKRNVWLSKAMRAMEAQSRGMAAWQWFMMIGLAMWLGILVNSNTQFLPMARKDFLFALFQLLAGVLILQGACEGFVIGVERLGARQKWDGFISGTVGSLLSTLPEFVVLAFLVQVDPLAAFITAIVTIFNNSLAYSVYSFFLPKDNEGSYKMPRSLTKAGGEILIAGSAITLIIGIVMVVMRVEMSRTALQGFDLVLIGIVLIVIYVFYLVMLVRYYSEGKDEAESLPPDPEKLGHDTSWRGIAFMFFLGVVGAYTGGEVIGGFAETALKELGLPTIPTAALLAFFAGISEYIIVYKSHQRGELGIALSNVFGGLTQVMFLLLPFGMIVIGVTAWITGDPSYVVPINLSTSLLMLLLFPLFHTLHQYMEQDKTINNLDAAAMTGIYVLLLYFLFTYTS